MHDDHIARIRSFHRAVTARAGALDDSYLARGRPLGEARVIYETGRADGIAVRDLRAKLGLDSGYLSRLLRALERDGLVETGESAGDGRVREVRLTAKGRAEYAAYDALSDDLARSILSPLDERQRDRLVAAMAEVERLLALSAIAVTVEPASGADGRWCLEQYYSELARRFDNGFDPEAGRNFDAAEMVPPSGWFVVARLDGRPVGCGVLKRLEGDACEVKRVWSSPTSRGMGVATRIMDRLEQIAAEAGFGVVRLDTNRALSEAHALYRKRGYREVACYNDNPYADHWFEKRL